MKQEASTTASPGIVLLYLFYAAENKGENKKESS
ncbi:hypothetical protein BV455_03007 [Parageobacillus caldoxylosilyticus]|jgi:hypothetical protein|nr:hypothetical protein [Parageobacillus caldoxylosilyticus]QXJ39641.1 hypothetical protein BV455_03007 [Parageobacillus caldoxylosilyticus]